MTTSGPQTDRPDDDSREHRTMGQKIRDAVLGDPDDERQDASADAGYGGRRDDAHVEPRAGGEAGDLGYPEGPRSDASGAPGYTESGRSAEEGATGYVATDVDRDGGVPDPVRDDVPQDGGARPVDDRTG